jgi:hypothetical protein
MLDIRLFARPANGVSSLVLTLVFFALGAVFFSIIQALQLVMYYGTLEASIRIVPITVFLIVGSIASPALAGRLGKRLLVTDRLAGCGKRCVLPVFAGRRRHLRSDAMKPGCRG